MSVVAVPSAELHNKLFHGLSDSSRLEILSALRAGELQVGELVEQTGLSQPNVSKHLACLWGCGLLAREKRGRHVYYQLIEGIEELFVAADSVLGRAGETIGACPLTDRTLREA